MNISLAIGYSQENVLRIKWKWQVSFMSTLDVPILF
jgi:hypothetical protein